MTHPVPAQKSISAHEIVLHAVTAANWHATLALAVYPEQQRFVANYVPIAAIALAKAFVRAGDLLWEPYAIMHAQAMVGFFALAYAPASADTYWIYHFFVDHRYQGQGYGVAALHALINYVYDQHSCCQQLNLHVHDENVHAQHLYQRVGFRATGRRIDGEPVYSYPMR